MKATTQLTKRALLKERVAELEKLCRAFARIFVTAKWVSAGLVKDSDLIQRRTEQEIEATMHEYRRLFEDGGPE